VSGTGAETGRFALPFVLGSLFALCGGGGAALLAIDPIATSRARAELAARGIECDDRLSVDVSFDLAAAQLAPTRCRLLRSRHAEAIDLPEGAQVTLSGLRPTAVSAPLVRLELGASTGPDVALGPMGPLGTLADLGGRVGETARAAAELAAHRPPSTRVDRLELVRGGISEVTLEAVVLESGEPLALRVERAEIAAMSGPMGISARGELLRIAGEATASTCHLEGDLTLSASLPIVGELSHTTHLALDGSALDGDAPQIAVTTR
jgi:hypothetical protein